VNYNLCAINHRLKCSAVKLRFICLLLNAVSDRDETSVVMTSSFEFIKCFYDLLLPGICLIRQVHRPPLKLKSFLVHAANTSPASDIPFK